MNAKGLIFYAEYNESEMGGYSPPIQWLVYVELVVYISLFYIILICGR